MLAWGGIRKLENPLYHEENKTEIPMTALLQKAIERVRALPEDHQDRVARLMLDEAEAPNEIDDHKEEERKPISEAIQEIFSDITEEEWEKLPKDGAAELDHYIYGTPKRYS